MQTLADPSEPGMFMIEDHDEVTTPFNPPSNSGKPPRQSSYGYFEQGQDQERQSSHGQPYLSSASSHAQANVPGSERSKPPLSPIELALLSQLPRSQSWAPHTSPLEHEEDAGALPMPHDKLPPTYNPSWLDARAAQLGDTPSSSSGPSFAHGGMSTEQSSNDGRLPSYPEPLPAPFRPPTEKH